MDKSEELFSGNSGVEKNGRTEGGSGDTVVIFSFFFFGALTAITLFPSPSFARGLL